MNNLATRLRKHWPSVSLLICGHPCCLKTTATKALTCEYDAFGLFTHQMGPIRAMWGSAFVKQRDRRYENICRLFTAAIRCHIPTIIEGTFANVSERNAIRVIAHRYKIPLGVIYAYASDTSTVAARFAHRAHTKTGPDHRARDMAIYFDSLNCYQPFTTGEIEKYAAYGEIDSSTKRLTRLEAKTRELRDVMLATEEAYRAISW